MKEFFSAMGKAFAVVFGSTSALALVLVLVAFVLRPVLRSWSQQGAANTQVEKPQALAKPREIPAFGCAAWDVNGRCVDLEPNPIPNGMQRVEFTHGGKEYTVDVPSKLDVALARTLIKKHLVSTPEWFQPDDGPRNDYLELVLRDCDAAGCGAYSGNRVVGRISRNEIAKAKM